MLETADDDDIRFFKPTEEEIASYEEIYERLTEEMVYKYQRSIEPSIIVGYGNDEGMIKFSCGRCGYSRASKKAGRYKMKTDEFFPRGGTFYGEERDYIPED